MLAHLPVCLEARRVLPPVPFTAMVAAAGLRAGGVGERRPAFRRRL